MRAVAQGARRRRARQGRGGDDPDHPSRPPHQLEQGRLAAGDRALPCARARPSRLPQGDGGLGHRPRDRRLRRRGRAGEGRRARWRRDRVLRPSDRPVLVAGHQQARRTNMAGRSTTACASASRCSSAIRRARRSRFPRRRAAWSATRIGIGASAATRAWRSRGASTASGLDRLRQRDPRPYRHRGGADAASSPAWASARRRISISPAKCAPRPACRPSTPRASRTSPPRATRSRAASSTWSA